MRSWHPLPDFSAIVASIFLGLFGLISDASAAKSVSVTLLHTNDLHSHFRPDAKPPYLGGVARLKTAITKFRHANPNTVLVDGGDWSEGQIYYVPGGGAEILRMMNHLGYDVAVVGNHDWLNGPDVLLKALDEVGPGPGMALVGANLNADAYSQKAKFNRRIPPYVIRNVGGAKVAFIGLSTYEMIYDRFFDPVKLGSPFEVTRDLARRLKRSVDAVIVISHNNLKMNRHILKVAPDVDLVVGAHDHRVVSEPIAVHRPNGSVAWLVEAGEYGHFLGKVELTVKPRKKLGSGILEAPEVHLLDYRLIQMDRSIAETPSTLKLLEKLEGIIEAHFGRRMFNEHLAHNHVDIDNHAAENLFGNLVTDSYLSAAPEADFALEHMRFMYTPLRKGSLTPSDFFNALAGVYDPRTDRTWTVKTFELKGSSLQWLLGALYSTKLFLKNEERPAPSVATSGISFRVNPWFGGLMTSAGSFDLSRYLTGQVSPLEIARLHLGSSPVDDIQIDGKPLRENQSYRIASSNGILFTADFINSILPNTIQLKDVRDTGIERWQVLANYVEALSPLTSEEISVGNRMRTVEPDLGLFSDDVRILSLRCDGDRAHARLQFRITNFGDRPSASRGANVRVFGARNPLLLASDRHWVELSGPRPLISLRRGEGQTVTIDVEVAGKNGLYPVKIVVDGVENEDNLSNNEVEYWLESAS